MLTLGWALTMWISLSVDVDNRVLSNTNITAQTHYCSLNTVRAELVEALIARSKPSTSFQETAF